jgi:hypothetical protein
MNQNGNESESFAGNITVSDGGLALKAFMGIRNIQVRRRIVALVTEIEQTRS